MRFDRWVFTAVLAVSALFTSGCAINRATANVDPSANLSTIKTIHVVQAPEDGRKINDVIATRLTQMGFVASTGLSKRNDVDANMTYVDRWMWDITMYMLELTIVLRDPSTDFALATGNSYHTSLTRQSPQEMVQEVTSNMFKQVKK